MRLRVGLASLAGRAAAKAARSTGGGASTLPGLVSLRIAPDLIERLGPQVPLGSILVTGTNGKTTTAGLIASILNEAGLVPIHNHAGSNLRQGVASTLLAAASWRGDLSVPPNTVGLFEVDEATVPGVIAGLQPRIVVVTNLFRDQLDRFGEVDTIAAKWRQCLRNLAPTTSLVLNADDPLVASLGSSAPGPVVYYGIEDISEAATALEHAADSKWCQNCESQLHYDSAFYGHLGHYRCTSCGATRPLPSVAATRLVSHGIDGTTGTIAIDRSPIGHQTDHSLLEVTIALPGLYNVYNALAAIAAANAFGIEHSAICRGVEQFTAAFGRAERLEIEGRSVYLLLAKNPTGLNEVLHTLFKPGQRHRLLLALNDELADGRDISWIWDADFERAAGQAAFVVASGIRAEDMAVRVKYAGLLPDGTDPMVERSLERALDLALEQTPPGETLYIVPTYTAMLELRRILTRRGVLEHYLERVG